MPFWASKFFLQKLQARWQKDVLRLNNELHNYKTLVKPRRVMDLYAYPCLTTPNMGLSRHFDHDPIPSTKVQVLFDGAQLTRTDRQSAISNGYIIITCTR